MQSSLGERRGRDQKTTAYSEDVLSSKKTNNFSDIQFDK